MAGSRSLCCFVVKQQEVVSIGTFVYWVFYFVFVRQANNWKQLYVQIKVR